MPEQISIIDLDSLKTEEDSEIHALFEDMVEGYIAILKTGAALQIGSSMAKDSSTILNGAVEAMRRAIKAGYIEQDHPLVVTTIDTLLEPEPITCYVPFAHQQLKAYCEKNGINLFLRVGHPPLHKQLSVLFFGAQKLPATASSGRNADCSIIWKLDTSRALLREVKADLPSKFDNIHWVSCSGSRSDESARRSNNMQSQGVTGLTGKHLAEQIEQSDKPQTWRFAPIAHWNTPQVFSCLLRSGSNPMTKPVTGKSIAGYAPHFGLLLNIYGEGANDTCDVATGKNGETSCNGSARYGCVTCGLVSTANSSEQQYRKEYRWGRFGDATSRLRDYIERVTADVQSRIYHPKAFDPAANNNVFLQPNVLHPRILSKLVWYAAQISEDSVAIANQFKKLVEQGRVHEDPGVMDIQNDTRISEKVKADYLAMYIARLQQPMWEMFTTQHALLLSLQWSLHGICALPYRPLKILANVRAGKRIPFPALNSELEAKGLFTRPKAPLIPEALVARLFKPATSEQAMLPWDITEAWQMPVSLSDLLAESNCLVETYAKHNRKIKVVKTTQGDVKFIDQATGTTLKLEANYLAPYIADMGEGETRVLNMPNQQLFTSDIVGPRANKVNGLPARVRFSTRKRKWNKGAQRFDVGRASLVTYTPSTDSNLAAQTTQSISYYLPNWMMTKDRVVDAFQANEVPTGEAFEFDEYAFAEFEQCGGIDELLELHDQQLAHCLKHRVSTRLFTGTRPIFKLLNGAGLSVSDSNRRYVLNYIKRVEIFNQANLFALGLCSREEITNTPFVVDMKAHRKQKAEYLQAVRKTRNANRTAAKTLCESMQSNPAETAAKNVFKRTLTFIQQDTGVRAALNTASLLNALGLGSHNKQEQLTFWLAQYGHVLDSMRSILQLLATDAERTAIEASYPVSMKLAKKIEQQVAKSRGMNTIDNASTLAQLNSLTAAITLTEKGSYTWATNSAATKASLLVAKWCGDLPDLNWNLLEYHLQQTLAAAVGLDRSDWQGVRHCQSWNDNGSARLNKAKLQLLKQDTTPFPQLAQSLVDHSSVTEAASLLANKLGKGYLAQRRALRQG